MAEAKIVDLSDEELDRFNFGAESLIFAYQGFDPLVVMSKLYACWEASDEKDHSFTSDVCSMVTLFMSRGTSLKKIKGRISKAGKDVVEALTRKYKITNRATEGGIMNDTITLSRVCACYPQVAVKVVLADAHRDIAPHVESAKCTHWTQFPSVIPRAQEWDAIYELWLEWAEEADKVLNGEKMDADRVDRFGRIARRSSRLDEAARVKIMKAFKIAKPRVVAQKAD